VKLVILNAGIRLEKHLPGAENVDRRIASAGDLSAFVSNQPERFALLWHESVREARPTLLGMSANWPARLAGCALFSSVPYANGTRQEAEQFLRENPALRDRLHVCSDPVRKEGPSDEVKERFSIFQTRVAILQPSAPPPLPFYLLEPEAPDADVFTAHIACLISANSRNAKTIASCLDWDLLGQLLSLTKYDLSSLKRALRRQPNQIRCPLCAYRGPLKHTLEGASDALPVLSGQTGLKTLRQLMDLDLRRELEMALKTHLRTRDACNKDVFVDLATTMLASMFEGRCALFCRRTELLGLCDKVEACITSGDSPGLEALVPALIDALSCDQGNNPLIEENYRIRLAQAL